MKLESEFLIFIIFKMFFYRKILANAFLISWRNKYLWFFGIFATFLSTSGGYEMMVRVMHGGEGVKGRSLADTGLFTVQGMNNLRDFFMSAGAGDAFYAIGVTFALIGLFLFVVWIATVSQCAIIGEFVRLTKGGVVKNEESGKMKRGFDGGMQYFWRVLSVNLIDKVALVLLFAFVGWVTVYAESVGSGFVFEALLIVCFVIFIALALSISFVAKYAIGFIVVRNKKAIDSIKLAFDLFVNHWIISLELAFMLLGINFVVGLLTSFIVLVIAIPFYFFAMLFLKVGVVYGAWFIIGLAGVTLIGLITIMGSLLTTFQITSWTGLYLELIRRTESRSKILRITDKVKRK